MVWFINLEPDILECEVKWALGSSTMNKASEGDRIPVELFKILKDDAVKVLHLIGQQIWKMQQCPQDWKRSVFIPIPKKGNVKKYTNYHTIAFISKSWLTPMQVRKKQLELAWNNRLVPNRKKSMSGLYIVTLLI